MNHHWARPLLLFALIAMASVGSLGAQAESGVFTFGAGLGGGRLSYTCAGCGGEFREDGPIGTLSMGFASSERLRASVEFSGWFGPRGTVNERQGSVVGSLRFFPLPRKRYFIEGGVGLARFRTNFSAAGGPDLRSSAASFVLGLGTEFPLRAGVRVVPRLSYSAGPSRDIQSGGGGGTGYQVGYHVVGVSVGFLYALRP